MVPGDTAERRKERGAFFTPYAIAEHLADWALRGDRNGGVVLDPTCGEGVFLLAAQDLLARQGRKGHLLGVDLHAASLDETARLLRNGSGSHVDLFEANIFEEATPGQLGARLPFVDAVIGNPPFVRYQEHRGITRKQATVAALAQGVRLSGLASSWAAVLIHASAFLKPDGRIAMVLPAELLSVGYAEPVRQWLKRRFSSVHLVLFEQLQFADADEQVVLLVARGNGGCNAFTLHHVRSADELAQLHIYDANAFAPQATGKWTDLLVPEEARGILRQTVEATFVGLSEYATVELGTVTGANKYFAISEATRRQYGLQEGAHIRRVVPPGSRHLRGVNFTEGHWQQLKLEGARVWLLDPKVRRESDSSLDRYLSVGERELGVDKAYKCSVRDPWWRPSVVAEPDYFFTYMSHVSPRLIRNNAGCTLVNSLHGVTLTDPSDDLLDTLPLLAVNTVTMLSAEVQGRAYGGGILKMEPREAAAWMLPNPDIMKAAWESLGTRRARLEGMMQLSQWDAVANEVDEALVGLSVLSEADIKTLRSALSRLRTRRQGK